MQNNTQKISIITGISGQDGAYLANLLLEKNFKVVGITRKNISSNFNNLEYLGIKDKLIIEECDLCNFNETEKIIKKYNPTYIFNLSGQSSVGYSFSNIKETIISNTIPVLNLLECIKINNPKIKFYQACSSEMYGKVEKLPINKKSIFNPLSPYAVSKLSSYIAVKNYRESFNLFAVSGILFNHESYLRSRNFFVKKIITEAIEVSRGKRDVIRVGNIDIKRDFGFAPEYVKAIYLMLEKDDPEDYLICSGKSILLRSIVEYIFSKFNISLSKLVIDKSFVRPTDIINIYGDNSEAKNKLKWEYSMDFFDVVDIIIDEEIKNSLI